MYTVEIKDIRIEFDRAHFNLIESFGGIEDFVKKFPGNYIRNLEKQWNNIYRVKLVNDDSRTSWTHLEFKDEKNYMMFLLKWSSV